MKTGLHIQEFFAGIGSISHQPSVRQYVENEIPRSCDSSPSERASPGRIPALGLSHRIPGDEKPPLTFRWIWSNAGR